jgi:alpha-D-ribose 1-methylphosphonate 5-triphosphate synthase subunit PhnI
MKQENVMTSFKFATVLRRGLAALAVSSALGLAVPALMAVAPFQTTPKKLMSIFPKWTFK